MNELEKIKHLEYYFPQIFADTEQREFGVMFYNTDNFDSHDSNHAIILNHCNYEQAVSEITEFYLSKQLNPRIYSSLEENQLDKLRTILERHKFQIDDYGYTDYLVWNGKSTIAEPYTLEFRRFTADDDFNVFAQITGEESVERTQKVIRRRVLCSDYYLYIGYANGIPVIMSSFQFDENMTARLDEVETAQAYQGKGYARQMTRHLTEVFETCGGKVFFTWAANDTAQRVYLNGGFEVKYKLPSWSAAIEKYRAEP
jgi:Acetyltransferase (GNAT) family.